jgi:hypothetical protein
MPDQPILFADPDKLVSDLNAFARFPVDGQIAQLAAQRIDEILNGGLVGLDSEGEKRPPRTREILAAVRCVIQMIRVNQIERDSVGRLKDAQRLISEALLAASRVKQIAMEDEAANDLVARTTIELRALLDARPSDAGNGSGIRDGAGSDPEAERDDPGSPE